MYFGNLPELESSLHPKGYAMIEYALNQENKITSVGGVWEEFAIANQGENLTKEEVLGESIFDYIRGAGIAKIYRALFEKVRKTQHGLSFNFRCDSPSCRRRMLLTLTPLPNQGIMCHTEILEAEPREYIPLLDKHVKRNESIVAVCCICADIRTQDGNWVGIEEESRRMGWLENENIPQLSHGFCPTCYKAQMELIAASV